MPTTAAKQVHVQAVQTVTPGKASEPNQARRISTTVPLAEELLRSHHRLVAYFTAPAAGEGGSADNRVGWFKESLNVALGERPLFAGRLRQIQENGEYNFEVKFNDAGLRLVQARAEVTISEFMETKGRDEREDILTYWSDVHETNSHFSVLCYVQVTSFEGGGYSIGVSCSVLLADTVVLVDFLKRWSQIHTAMLADDRLSKFPLFHLSKLKGPAGVTSLVRSTPLDDDHPTSTIRTVLLLLDHPPAGTGGKALAAEAVVAAGDAAERGLFYVIEGGKEGAKVGTCERGRAEGGGGGGVGGLVAEGTGGLKVVGLDALGSLEEVLVFGEGDRAMHVSYHVQSKDGVVLIARVPDGPALIAVAVPTKNLNRRP